MDHGTVIEKLKFLGVPIFIVRWTTSFLCERQQRVKISDVVSNWTVLRGGMPQGSWLGPLIFIILIDELRLRLRTHKILTIRQYRRHLRKIQRQACSKS